MGTSSAPDFRQRPHRIWTPSDPARFDLVSVLGPSRPVHKFFPPSRVLASCPSGSSSPSRFTAYALQPGRACDCPKSYPIYRAGWRALPGRTPATVESPGRQLGAFCARCKKSSLVPREKAIEKWFPGRRNIWKGGNMPKAYFEPQMVAVLGDVLNEAKAVLECRGEVNPTNLDWIARRILELASQGLSPWLVLAQLRGASSRV